MLHNLSGFAIVFCVSLSLATVTYAQGTASAPSTVHEIDPTNTVYMGGPNDLINGPGPQPIDLDVDGLPWRKALVAGPNGFFNDTIRIIETIQNVGTEPWTDWHEIDAHIGSHGTGWGSVFDVQVNGSPITYTADITVDSIDLYDFSQPVLPGDTLFIFKQLEVFTDNVAAPGTLVASLLEYPTTNIPEPSTVVILGSGALAFVAYRRRSGRL